MPNKKLFHLTVIFILLFFVGNARVSANAGKPHAGKMKAAYKTLSHNTAGSDIQLTITGGDMAGKYSAPCEDCCSYGIAGDKVFGTQYSENGKADKELSSVQLIVNDVTGNKSTENFTLTVSFGKLFGANSKSFNIDTNDGKTEGSGKLDLSYSGDKAVVTIKGTSAEGAGIDLKITCNKVSTMDNINK